MKHLIRTGMLLLCALLLSAHSASAQLEASPFIEAAFGMLEETNPFIPRYEQITGGKVEVLFPLGVPYMFAGKAGEIFWAFYPEYRAVAATQSSDYFRKESFYICGLDCSGFTNYINRKCKRQPHEPLNTMMLNWEHRKFHHLYNQTPEQAPPPYNELKDTLVPGDFLLIHHTGAKYRHIMMYIGTLRDFGYTAESEPELSEYLDYPLVIHCGNSPVYGARFQQFIDSHPEQYGRCITTDGGVQISIVGVPPELAPVHEHVQLTDYDYFVMNDGGYVLTVISMEDLGSFCWYRQ